MSETESTVTRDDFDWHAAILNDNFETGAIDLVTYLGAMDDLANGVVQSYAQALYQPGEEN